MAILCSYVSQQDDVAMTTEIIFFSIMMIISFCFTRLWQYYIDNVKEYEELYKKRLRRLAGRVERTGRTRKNKSKEETKDK